MLKEVPKYFTFKDSCFSSIPIWVNLRFLPKQCWSKGLLSRIARKIGKPIAMDVVTGEKTKHEGARLLVEVDLDKPIVEKISIMLPDGRIWDQGIDYETKPVVCKKCKGLGHEECNEADQLSKAASRGRSRARRAKSKKPVMQEKAKENVGETSSPKVSILPESTPIGKGKGIMEEEVKDTTPKEIEGPKKWQLVSYKKPTPPETKASYASVVLKPQSSKIQQSAVGTAPLATRPKKIVDDTLPSSPNTFGALFEEDERMAVHKDGGTPGSGEANKVRVVGQMEEEVPWRALRRNSPSL